MPPKPVFTLDFTQAPPTQTPSGAPRIPARTTTFDVRILVPDNATRPSLTRSEPYGTVTVTGITPGNSFLRKRFGPSPNKYIMTCTVASNVAGRVELTISTALPTEKEPRTAVGTIDVSGGTA